MTHALRVLALVLIAILLSIGVPNLMNARSRGKQKKTMGDLRTVATALESYSIDTQRYPTIQAKNPAEFDVLAHILEPTYVKSLPRSDGWGGAFVVVSTTNEYSVTSFGRDGLPNSVAPHHVEPNGGTTDFRADIVFSTGSFTQFPDGTMN